MPIGSQRPAFAGRVLMIGCGSVGQTVLPLLLREFAIDPGRVAVLAADGRGKEVAAALGVRFETVPLTRESFARDFWSRGRVFEAGRSGATRERISWPG